MDETTVAVVLWGATALFLGWTWVPALISSLGGTRYTNGGTEDPTALPPVSTEPDYAFWHRQIVALGYEPLGTGFMQITFHGPHWRYETRVRTFYSRTRQTYAFVQKQPRPMDVWWLTMFATCWQDGGLLLTSNAVDEPPDGSDYVVQGMESLDLAVVEELHLGQKQRLQSAGKRPDPDGSLETILRATARNSGPAARHLGIRLGQSYLLTHGLVHLFLSAPVAYLTGPGHWGVPMVNLILGGLLGIGDYAAKRRAQRLVRDQLLAAPAHREVES
ncbi:MAG TPA: hypothetical protein VKE40_17205 [Gemmataceae bacterium]|nr:hypothetical protein [Gemmataceae bacterium]